jgi:molybdenum cofactor cytidylyltransferase
MSASSLPVGAVILAAGSASRFGALKQVIAIDGEPMVRRIARHALASGLRPVIVVVGAQGDQVVDCLHNLDIQTIHNPDWDTGMGHSLATGVKALFAKAATIRSLMVLLADQPAVRTDDLEDMLARHAHTPDRILASRHQDRLGPPCLFPASFAGELMSLTGARGAHAVLERHAALVDTFDLPAAFRDIDTPDDYAAWISARGGDDG